MGLLETIDTPLRRVSSAHGGEYAGPCPWCGGRDRFRVWPEADRPGYWCRQCGKRGDAIQYLRDRHGLPYREACDRLHLPTRDRTARPITPPPAPEPPGATWQARAMDLIEASTRRLWGPAGVKALAYLRRRDFAEATIRQARLGYHPCEVREAPGRWGVPSDHRSAWLPRGVVIPVMAAATPWMVWIRRPVGAPKYVAVTGSRHYDAGIETVRPGHPAMLVEGILDAWAIWQAAGDLVAPVAVGTRHGTPRTIGRLSLASPLLIGLDADAAGDAAAAWWLDVFPQARRWRPTCKDPAAMLEAGADVRRWIGAGLDTWVDTRPQRNACTPCPTGGPGARAREMVSVATEGGS
jgi:DNA primase